jgi:hypothetical protein
MIKRFRLSHRAAKLQDFVVFLAKDVDLLRHKMDLKDHAWCGVQKVWFDTEECRAGISPFGDTYVYVPSPKRAGIFNKVFTQTKFYFLRMSSPARVTGLVVGFKVAAV